MKALTPKEYAAHTNGGERNLTFGNVRYSNTPVIRTAVGMSEMTAAQRRTHEDNCRGNFYRTGDAYGSEQRGRPRKERLRSAYT